MLANAEVENVRSCLQATSSHLKLLNVWEIERRGEVKRFAKHNKLGNRKLLWHGTNIAVVAAILKAGLRIMPHSGGRVGRGLYLAAENSKSAAYVCAGRQGTQLVGVGLYTNRTSLGSACCLQGKATCPGLKQSIDDNMLHESSLNIPGMQHGSAKQHWLLGKTGKGTWSS